MMMTEEMARCAAEIRRCWRLSDAALVEGDAEEANSAFARVFEVVDTFPAIREEDVRALQFLCVLTWVKVSAALEMTGQEDEAGEARQEVFTQLDEVFGGPLDQVVVHEPSLRFLSEMGTEEVVDSLGRLYMMCSKAGRADAVLWGKWFLDLDVRLHGAEPPVVH